MSKRGIGLYSPFLFDPLSGIGVQSGHALCSTMEQLSQDPPRPAQGVCADTYTHPFGLIGLCRSEITTPEPKGMLDRACFGKPH